MACATSQAPHATHLLTALDMPECLAQPPLLDRETEPGDEATSSCAVSGTPLAFLTLFCARLAISLARCASCTSTQHTLSVEPSSSICRSVLLMHLGDPQPRFVQGGHQTPGLLEGRLGLVVLLQPLIALCARKKETVVRRVTEGCQGRGQAGSESMDMAQGDEDDDATTTLIDAIRSPFSPM